MIRLWNILTGAGMTAFFLGACGYDSNIAAGTIMIGAGLAAAAIGYWISRNFYNEK